MMKAKWFSLVLGSALLMTPLMSEKVFAQGAEPLPIFAQLELSPTQESQMTQIRRQTRSQIQQIIRPEQRNQFKAMLEQGEGLRQAIAAMNLSADQRAKLREVFQATRAQVSGTLTPAQKQQIKQGLQTRLMDWIR
jgi:periplasmic protein CpxP/Spy